MLYTRSMPRSQTSTIMVPWTGRISASPACLLRGTGGRGRKPKSMHIVWRPTDSRVNFRGGRRQGAKAQPDTRLYCQQSTRSGTWPNAQKAFSARETVAPLCRRGFAPASPKVMEGSVAAKAVTALHRERKLKTTCYTCFARPHACQ